MRLQSVLFHDHLGPHALQQFILGDQTSAAFNQCYKQVEGMRADAHRETGCQGDREKPWEVRQRRLAADPGR